MPVVVIPVLDEALALPALLAAMPAGYQPLVVDNGSTDGSADVARRHGARVVTEPARGFGAACWAGLQAADPADGVVCFMDGDGSFDPAELVRVAEPVLSQAADLVLGARRTSVRGAWPLHARLANQALAGLLNRTPPLRRGGTHLRDLGPMRAARRRELLTLDLRDRRSGWPLEMVLAAADAGWRVREVDVAYHARVGQSKVTGTLRGTLTVVGDMSRLLVASALRRRRRLAGSSVSRGKQA
ncbi:MAG: glycosyltransferase family 2 protein [Acidimicrobiales bacterium]